MDDQQFHKQMSDAYPTQTHSTFLGIPDEEQMANEMSALDGKKSITKS